MNEMLVYSIHLGNDKNKTKKAKEIAKNNQSNTTSSSNNSIQNLAQLSKANNHNLRKYDNKTELIPVIYGTNNLIMMFKIYIYKSLKMQELNITIIKLVNIGKLKIILKKYVNIEMILFVK